MTGAEILTDLGRRRAATWGIVASLVTRASAGRLLGIDGRELLGVGREPPEDAAMPAGMATTITTRIAAATARRRRTAARRPRRCPVASPIGV
jgi:hypothetical protein